MLAKWNVDIRAEAQVGELSAGMRQLLEIIKALSRGVPEIILDEPTAALSNSEKRILFEQVKALKGLGIWFIYISHQLEVVFEIADTVTILHDGLVVKAREKVSKLDVESIADLLMGVKTARSVREDHTQKNAPPLLQVRTIRVPATYQHDIDFRVLPGEIMALAGLVGGDKEALAMMLAGQLTPQQDKISGPGGLPLSWCQSTASSCVVTNNIEIFSPRFFMARMTQLAVVARLNKSTPPKIT